MLPTLRGPSPIQTALLDGLEKTGVSIMRMDAEIDHGPILNQKEIKIYKKYDYKSLKEKLAEISNKILLPAIQDMLDKKISPKEQEHHTATFTKIINKKDGRIIWSKSANQIEGLYKAFCVWPKIFCYWEKESQPGNPQKIIFWKIKSVKETSESTNKKYGEVFKNEKGKILIKTGNGLIEINKIQLPGKNAMNIDEFCNGQPQFIGAILS
jgi:methionyl-tRNA formyltransferase